MVLLALCFGSSVDEAYSTVAERERPVGAEKRLASVGAGFHLLLLHFGCQIGRLKKEASLLNLFQAAGGSVSSGGADVETPLVCRNGGQLK